MGKPNKRAPILYHTQLPLRLGRWSDSLSNVCTRSMSRQLRVVLQWPLTRVAFVLSWYESHRPTVSEMPGQASVSRTCLLSAAYLTVTTESVRSESNEVLFTRLGWRWLSTAMFCVVFPWACLYGVGFGPSKMTRTRCKVKRVYNVATTWRTRKYDGIGVVAP